MQEGQTEEVPIKASTSADTSAKEIVESPKIGRAHV